MEVNYNYNNGTILKFLRKVLNEINQEYVDSGMRTAFLLKRYIEKYKMYPDDAEKGPKLALLCMMKDIGLFYMNGEVPDDDPALAAASSYAFLHHCSPLGVSARPLLFYKAKYIEGDFNDSTGEAYDLGLLMTLLNQVVLCVYDHSNAEEIEEYLKAGKKQGLYKPDQVKKVVKLLKDDPTVLEKMNSESNLFIYETQKYISGANFSDMELEGFIDTTSYAFEFHNHETLAHTITTASIAYDLALKCRLTPEMADVVKLAARVHDVGKIRVPREILCYPGRLEGEMLEEMQRHVVYTREIIEGSFSYKIVDIASNHHEKLDGSGYPRGLKDIDLSSGDKVIAVADITSALYCKRSYKAAFDDDKIQEILLSDAKNGKLDLRIVNHLIDNYDEIMANAKTAEAQVLDIYNAMKEEYEKLSQAPSLRMFFDEEKEPEPEPEEEKEEPQEQIVYTDENGNILEGYVPDGSEVIEEAPAMTAEDYLNGSSEIPEAETEPESEAEPEYSVPDELVDEDDVYHAEYDDGIKPEEDSSFEDYVNDLPENSGEESEEVPEEDSSFEDFVNDLPEDSGEESEEVPEEDSSFEDYVNDLPEDSGEESEEVPEEDSSFEDYVNDLPENSSEESEEVPEEDSSFEEYINDLPEDSGEEAEKESQEEDLDPLDESLAAAEEVMGDSTLEDNIRADLEREAEADDKKDKAKKKEKKEESGEDDEFLAFINSVPDASEALDDKISDENNPDDETEGSSKDDDEFLAFINGMNEKE